MAEELLQERYQLEDQIGQGGMGSVYRGYDLVLKRPVAIKLISNVIPGSQGQERLLLEAQAAAQLNDPHIVAVYDVGRAGKTPFIVMELLEGQTLRCDEPFALAEIVAIGRQICQALDHAHGKGIIHRDLKPDNIFLTTSQGVKLMDFGLARIADGPQITEEGTLMGTVNYIAPEVLSGQAATIQSDLYALGLILYEMSAGQPPFAGENVVAILSQHLHSPVTPPSTHNPAIPMALDAIILKLLEKNPADRPASGSDVDAALAQLTSDALELALSESPAEFSLLQRIVRGRLVGRQAELAQLHLLWQMAWQGQAHLALISGEPGAGKTRLANELLVEARLRGIPVLQGSCYEYEAITPYLPFVEALRDWIHYQPAEHLRKVLGLDQGTAIAAELARLAPEIETKLGPQPPNPPLSPEEARSRLFDYLAIFLTSLAEAKGLVLFIDDLHWTDTGTINLIHYLIRRLRDEKLLILANYREVELDRAHPLAAALVRWNRERLASRIPLNRLSEAETADMLAAIFSQDRVDPPFAAAIFRETEGNPFFIEEVVKAMIDQEQIYRRDGEWISHDISDLAIPQSVKEAIGHRLDRLSPDCIAMLHLAAVLGKQFAFTELAAVYQENGSRDSEDALLDLLDEAAGAQLVRPLDSDDFVFTHDKIREVLIEELNPVRRRRLHLRIGQTIETLYGANLSGHVQTLAYHFTEAGDLDRCLAYCRLAGEKAAALFSLDEAARYLERARDCAESLESAQSLLDIESQLGEVHLERGAFKESAEAYKHALSLAKSPSQIAVLKGRLGGVAVVAGDSSSVTYLTEAIQELDPQSQPLELAQALGYLGRYHHYRSDFTQAIAHFEEARRLAEPLDDVRTLTNLYAYLAGAYQHRVEFFVSMSYARKLVAMGQERNYPPAEAVGYEFLAEDANHLGRWSEAYEFAVRDEEIGDRIGAQDRVCWAQMCRAWSCKGSGRLAKVLEISPEAIELAAGIGESRVEFFIRYIYTVALINLGELSQAETELARLEACAAAINQQIMTDYAAHARMAFFNKQGRWQETIETAGPFIHQADEIHPQGFLLGAPEAIAALAEAGVLDQAEAVVQIYLARTDADDLAYYRSLGQLVVGRLRLAQGQLDEALRAATAAVDTLKEFEARPDLVRALVQRGRVYQGMGNPEEAAADFRDAELLAAEIGMAGDANLLGGR
jgi:tetratricopeptide (TPR) repeat protein